MKNPQPCEACGVTPSFPSGRFCPTCKQYHRKDRKHRFEVLRLFDAGVGPLSIAVRLEMPAREVWKIIHAAKRTRSIEWGEEIAKEWGRTYADEPEWDPTFRFSFTDDEGEE